MAQRNGIQEEFVTLIKSAGWRPAEAARQLDLSKSSVSSYVNGLADPQERTMKLLRRLVMEKEDKGQSPKDSIRDAFRQQNWSTAMKELERIDRAIEELQGARDGIHRLLIMPAGFVADGPKKESGSKEPDTVLEPMTAEQVSLLKKEGYSGNMAGPVSSEPHVADAIASIPASEGAASDAPPIRLRKHKAASPNARKPPPSGGAS